MRDQTMPTFIGGRVKLFRFDIVQASRDGEHPNIMLLTAKIDGGEIFAWGLRKELAEELLREMTSAQAQLRHELDEKAPEVVEFLQSDLLDLLPDGFKLPRDDFLKLIHLDAWPDIYILDATNTDDVTRRVSIAPPLAAVFLLHLTEAVAAMT